MKVFFKLILLTCLAGYLPTVLAEREVRVGVYDNPPKLIMGTDSLPSGIFGDLIKEIASNEGWTLVPVSCEWESCLKNLESGTIDLMPDVAYIESRSRIFDFHHIPALTSWSQIYRRNDVSIQSMLDLNGKRIAVLEDSSQEAYLNMMLAGFGIRSQMIRVNNFKQGFEAVATGKADAIAANHHFGDFSANEYKLIETSLIFQPSNLFYATAKGKNPELLQAIDKNLDEWKNNPDSPYFKILKKWGSPAEAPSIPEAFLWGLGSLLTLLTMASGFAWLLKIKVAQRTAELRISEDKLKTILDSVDAYIFIKDVQLRYQYVNNKVCKLFGRTYDEIVGKNDSEFFDPDTVTKLNDIDKQVLGSGQAHVKEEVNRTKNDNETKTYLTSKIPLKSPDNKVYALCGVATDITEQRQFIEEIHQLAFYDSLTHLPNRAMLIDKLEKLLGDSQPFNSHSALLLINLDNFKDFNDTYGYNTGDQLLKQIAQRLSNFVSASDFIARLSGDEFAFLCTAQINSISKISQKAEDIANNLIKVLSDDLYVVGHIHHKATICIGAVVLASSQTTVESALKHADLALFEAKATGRNKVSFFQPDMEAAVAARAVLEAELREGLEQNQFVVHYQPQVDINHQLLGYEVLVRWQHPQRGLVPPNSFINLAEVTGLIDPLGMWILRTACMQLKAWSNDLSTANLVVAVNVSAYQLHNPNFVNQVIEVLQQTGANPNRLELEITESLLVKDIDGSLDKMKTLKAYGIRLSMDDFGTGYSSLNYLKRLPLDQLKIDQSFVRDLAIDPNDMFIVKAIVEMGRSLNMSVLAEGVETEAQRDALAQLGCIRYQGYFFGKPVPVSELQLISNTTDTIIQ